MARKLFERQAIRRRTGTLASGVTMVVYSDAAATVLADISTSSGGSSIAGSTVTSGDIAGLGPAALRFYGPTDGTDTLFIRVPSDTSLGIQKIEASTDDRLDILEAAGGGDVAVHSADTTVVHGIADTAQVALRNAANTFTVDQVFKSGRPILDVDGFISGPPGSSSAADTAGIEAASLALEALGGGFLWFNNRTYFLERRVSGQQQSGGILWRPGQSLVFAGTTLQLLGNTHFIHVQDPRTATVAVMTADVTVGMVNYTVDTSAGFAIGDTVHVRAGDNAFDAVETLYSMFAKVAAVPDGTHLTLDRPVNNTVTVASTTSANKRIVKLSGLVENVALIGQVTLVNDQSGGSHAESGIDITYSRNLRVASVAGEHVGAGLILGGYVDTFYADTLRVTTCDAQGGQLSKGRCLNFFNATNVTVDTLLAERFETNVVFAESYSRKIRIRNLHIVNNHPSRVQASSALFSIVQGSECNFDDVVVEGYGGTVLADEGGTTGNIISFANIELQTVTQLKGGVLLSVMEPAGTFTIGTSRFRRVRTFSRKIALTVSQATSTVLPSGLYRKVFVYTTNTANLTGVYIQNSSGGGPPDVKGSLTANTTVDLSAGTANLGSYGSDYPFNNVMGKKIDIYTDASMPASQYLVIECEYFPDVVNDGAEAMLQVVP